MTTDLSRLETPEMKLQVTKGLLQKEFAEGSALRDVLPDAIETTALTKDEIEIADQFEEALDLNQFNMDLLNTMPLNKSDTELIEIKKKTLPFLENVKETLLNDTLTSFCKVFDSSENLAEYAQNNSKNLEESAVIKEQLQSLLNENLPNTESLSEWVTEHKRDLGTPEDVLNAIAEANDPDDIKLLQGILSEAYPAVPKEAWLGQMPKTLKGQEEPKPSEISDAVLAELNEVMASRDEPIEEKQLGAVEAKEEYECPTCGAAVSEEAVYCYNCGELFTGIDGKAYCPVCRKELDENGVCSEHGKAATEEFYAKYEKELSKGQ